MNNVTFGTGDGCWNTPEHLKEAIYDRYNINFDPCPVNPNFDGLQCEWGDRNYCNPPFHELGRWIAKAIEEQSKNRTTVVLLPCHTSTSYFQELVLPNVSEICFFEGRIRFVNQSKKKSAASPWPNMLCVFKGKSD